MKFAILGSLLLSILHSVLFYGTRLGISVVLFAIAAIFIFIKILENKSVIKNKKAYILSIPIILLSSTYFIFNNLFLNILNIVVIIALFIIMLAVAILGEMKLEKIIKKMFYMIFGAFNYLDVAIKSIIKFFCGFKKNKIKKENKKERKVIKQIIIGAMFAVPILIVIVSLLTSADIIFQNVFQKIYIVINSVIKNTVSYINIGFLKDLIIRLVIIILIFIYFVALMYNLIKKQSLFNSQTQEENTLKNNINIEGIILNTILTILNIVYLIFTITQSIYFISQLNIMGNLNYAQYARMGFFQLMIVSAINFVIILITNLNKKPMSKSIKKYTKIMNVLLAIFTIIILILSILRMNLYEQKYGYTFLRLMVYFIEITELILIIPTIAYIINKKIKIIKAYFVIVICAYVAINFVNIDALIAKRNIDKYFNAEGKEEIDYIYLQRNLSTDAVPELIRLLSAEDENIRESMNNYFYRIKTIIEDNNENEKWQEFNISRIKAKEEIKNLKTLEEPYGKYMYNSNEY